MRESLETMARRNWSTPTTDRATYAQRRGVIYETLPGQAANWATPTTRDYKDGSNPSSEVPTNGLLGRQAPRSEIVGSSICDCARTLNPQFVEALMGWPEHWSTARIGSASSVTEWFRRWRLWLSEL